MRGGVLERGKSVTPIITSPMLLSANVCRLDQLGMLDIANRTLHPILGEDLKAKLLLALPNLCVGKTGSLILLKLEGFRRSKGARSLQRE
jgi:hypothetical protein